MPLIEQDMLVGFATKSVALFKRNIEFWFEGAAEICTLSGDFQIDYQPVRDLRLGYAGIIAPRGSQLTASLADGRKIPFDPRNRDETVFGPPPPQIFTLGW